MEVINCESAGELASAIDKLPPGVLFRGQIKEYLRADGSPDLRSSIDRHGCIPDRMLKWMQYSRFILGTFIKTFDTESDLATDQAILQHYGWRSLFLDASSSALVAAWFAGHKFQNHREVELVEDCWEDPAFAIRERAWYQAADEQIGCLYAIGRKGLRRNGIECVDLVEIATEEGRHRCNAQSAFMVGPLSGNLPDDCIVAKILAPTSVFRDYLVEGETLTQSTLFPNEDLDPFLATLMAIPWVKRYEGEESPTIDFYDRGLSFPEYSMRPMKRNGPGTCFYRRFWIADVSPIGSPFSETDFYLTGETLFHGAALCLKTFPNISQLLENKRSVIVEIDGLIAYPYGTDGSYAKGVYFERQEDGTILITELAVDHYGLRPAGFGITKGLYYKVNKEGEWERITHPKECDCGHESHHRHHLIVASHFESSLENNDFTQVRDHIFATSEVEGNSDQAAIDWMKTDNTKPSPA